MSVNMNKPLEAQLFSRLFDMNLRPENWHKDAVIYQIYPRSFQDSNGDGVGDIPGITQRLDHLKNLGVDTLWLSPFFKSPMKDFGYDVSDYCDVDPLFGTLADFDDMVQQAHARGLRVVIDQVLSHTSDQHPGLLKAAAAATTPRPTGMCGPMHRPTAAHRTIGYLFLVVVAGSGIHAANSTTCTIF